MSGGTKPEGGFRRIGSVDDCQTVPPIEKSPLFGGKSKFWRETGEFALEAGGRGRSAEPGAVRPLPSPSPATTGARARTCRPPRDASGCRARRRRCWSDTLRGGGRLCCFWPRSPPDPPRCGRHGGAGGCARAHRHGRDAASSFVGGTVLGLVVGGGRSGARRWRRVGVGHAECTSRCARMGHVKRACARCTSESHGGEGIGGGGGNREETEASNRWVFGVEWRWGRRGAACTRRRGGGST